jgi:hypothetical protein
VAVTLESILGTGLDDSGSDVQVTLALRNSIAAAQSTATAAQAAADAALVAANEADDTADAAQTTANTALTNAATAQSTADAKAAIAGQLGGTAASPDVRGIRETAGPTLLTIGAIADGALCRRVGNTVVGVQFSDIHPLQPYYAPICTELATPVTQTSGRAHAYYIGYFAAGTILDYVTIEQVNAAAGAGQGEVAIASSAARPGLNAESDLTILAAGLVSDMTVPNTVKTNVTPFGHTLVAKTHVWAVTRSAFATTQPTLRHASRLRQFYTAQTKNSVADLTTLVGTTLTTWSAIVSAAAMTLMPRL